VTPSFKDYKLRIVKPDFDSPLTSYIIELEKLRRKRVDDPVPDKIFMQLKEFFHDLESLQSARIEGNNTTVSELVEKKISGEEDRSDKQRELDNTKKALDFIEENIKEGSRITQSFIMELHKIVVDGLLREGSQTPGMLRNKDVVISGSEHTPPSYLVIRDYVDELMEFINREEEKKYNLLITAIAHHRFAWIHPFDNGNGRVVRLMTYAMLIKQNFHLDGRILNPTAVFCINRDRYYEMLAKADEGSDTGVLAWCDYVLKGLLDEINKIDNLSNRTFLVRKILLPSLAFSMERKNITKEEYEILKLAVTKPEMEITASDVNKIVQSKHAPQTSRKIKKLCEKKMLEPVEKNARKYIVVFTNNYLLRGLTESLQRENFIGITD